MRAVEASILTEDEVLRSYACKLPKHLGNLESGESDIEQYVILVLNADAMSMYIPFLPADLRPVTLILKPSPSVRQRKHAL